MYSYMYIEKIGELVEHRNREGYTPRPIGQICNKPHSTAL